MVDAGDWGGEGRSCAVADGVGWVGFSKEDYACSVLTALSCCTEFGSVETIDTSKDDVCVGIDEGENVFI